jgi:hypothetical protein
MGRVGVVLQYEKRSKLKITFKESGNSLLPTKVWVAVSQKNPLKARVNSMTRSKRLQNTSEL